MAKLPVSKLRIVGLKEHRDALLLQLQGRGDVHISKNELYSGAESSVEDGAMVERVEAFLKRIGEYAPRQGALAAMLSGGVELSVEEAERRAMVFAPQVEVVVSGSEYAAEELLRSVNEIKKQEALAEALLKYASVEMPIGQIVETKETMAQLYVVRADLDLDAILMDQECVAVRMLEQGLALVFVHNGCADGVLAVLEGAGVQSVNLGQKFPDYTGMTPAAAHAVVKEKIKELQKTEKEAVRSLSELASHEEDAQVWLDVMGWGADRKAAAGRMMTGASSFAADVWIPKKEVEALQYSLKEDFEDGVVVVEIPMEGNEAVPALLQNNSVVRPFEMLTELYGAPAGSDVDPTPFMAPFFVIFFGICLSDVGYGALLVLTSTFFLLMGRYAQDTRDMLRFILFCGLSATLGGVLLGGWFGMTLEQAPQLLIHPSGDHFWGQLLSPIEGSGPMNFLIFSLVVGVVQLLFGVIVEAYKYWVNSDVEAMFMSSFAWLTAFVGAGLALYLGTDTATGTTLLYVAGVCVLLMGLNGIFKTKTTKEAVIKVLTSPFSGLFAVLGNAMSYLSDILSYSRLMALGLATGVVGFAMNKTAEVFYEMVGGGVIGVILAVGVLVFGHGLNFGLSMLGASIHSMRLQFIEFFGRFYQGGGAPFKALARKTKHILLRHS